MKVNGSHTVTHLYHILLFSDKEDELLTRTSWITRNVCLVENKSTLKGYRPQDPIFKTFLKWQYYRKQEQSVCGQKLRRW